VGKSEEKRYRRERKRKERKRTEGNGRRTSPKLISLDGLD